MTVNQAILIGASDELISRQWQAEEQILITFNLDFTDVLNDPPAKFPGFLVVRSLRQAMGSLKALFKQNFDNYFGSFQTPSTFVLSITR